MKVEDDIGGCLFLYIGSYLPYGAIPRSNKMKELFSFSSGSENIVELHGSLFKTRCTGCGRVESNRDSPICESLRDKGKISERIAYTPGL